MAAALTLTSALANATEVYRNRTTRCLTRDFQVATNLTNRATFDELMEKVSALPLKEGEAKKDRLMVILRLIYEKPKEAPKEDDVKAQVLKAMEALKAQPKKEASQSSKKKLEAQLRAQVHISERSGRMPPAVDRQAKLSTLLLGYDVIYMNYKYVISAIKILELIESTQNVVCPLFLYFHNTKDRYLELNQKELSNPIYSDFVLQWAKLFDPKTYVLNLKYLSLEDYQQLCKLRSHPDPEMSKIFNLICALREMEFEGQKIAIYKPLDEAARHCAEACGDSAAIQGFYQTFCPNLVYLLANPRPTKKDLTLEVLNKRKEACEAAEKEFFAAYEKYYRELHQIQEKDRSKTKQAFLTQYNRRMHPSHIPGRDVVDTFLPPDQLLKELSLATITQDEKEVVSEPKEEKKKSIRQVEKQDASQSQDKKKTQSLEEPKKEASEESSPASQTKASYAEVAAKRPPSPEKSEIRAILEKRELSFDKSSYDERVLAWFDKRREIPRGFTPDDAVWKHAFTTIVDQFVGTPYSFKDVWKNEKTGKDDTCFCIMADITFVNKETVSGVFQFTFDENGICYHRWFGKMSNIQRLDKLIAQKREKIEFPPLMKPVKPAFEEVDKTQFAIDPYFSSITFEDKENGLIIKIYKVMN